MTAALAKPVWLGKSREAPHQINTHDNDCSRYYISGRNLAAHNIAANHLSHNRKATMKGTLAVSFSALVIAGCTSVNDGLTTFNEGMASLNKTLASGLPANQTSQTGQRKFGSAISQEQELKIKENLNIKTNDNAINQAIAESSPVIENFARAESCINNHLDSSLELYTAPGGRMNTAYAPMMSMKYHDRSRCVTVAKLQGWYMPARNALQFEIVYVSEMSGEVKKRGHEVVKQPNGEWLFTPQI